MELLVPKVGDIHQIARSRACIRMFRFVTLLLIFGQNQNLGYGYLIGTATNNYLELRMPPFAGCSLSVVFPQADEPKSENP